MVDVIFAWPMPLVWLMLAGLVAARRRIGRRLLGLAAGLLVISAMPIVGRALQAPLASGAVADPDSLQRGKALAVLVPTAGSFRDAAGVWWPEEGSIRRFVAGRELAKRLALPMIVAGGSPLVGQPPEAGTVAALVAAGDVAVTVLPAGRNSAETAAALVAALGAAPDDARPPLILVTDRVHMMRMRASLRHQGIAVAAVATPDAVAPRPAGQANRFTWRLLVPSRSGLDATGAAMHEYLGITWYLVTGNITISDL
jgi:uncharacterized SAM-binding protein YcdF (DUF218 family)